MSKAANHFTSSIRSEIVQKFFMKILFGLITIWSYYLILYYSFRRKQGKSLKKMFDNAMYNVKRLGRLILRGSPGKIFFPDKVEGKNNLDRIVTFSKRMLNDTLKETLNRTTVEIVDMVRNFPKIMTKNFICLTPNIILKIRQMQSDNESEAMMQNRFASDLRLTLSKNLI